MDFTKDTGLTEALLCNNSVKLVVALLPRSLAGALRTVDEPTSSDVAKALAWGTAASCPKLDTFSQLLQECRLPCNDPSKVFKQAIRDCANLIGIQSLVDLLFPRKNSVHLMQMEKLRQLFPKCQCDASPTRLPSFCNYPCGCGIFLFHKQNARGPLCKIATCWSGCRQFAQNRKKHGFDTDAIILLLQLAACVQDKKLFPLCAVTNSIFCQLISDPFM